MLKDKLKSLRMSLGISQKKFAEDLGISQQAVGSWEVGRTEPSSDYLTLIADYFNVSVDYLLGQNKTTPPVGMEENKLLTGFRALNKDGRITLMNVLNSLRMTHAAAR